MKNKVLFINPPTSRNQFIGSDNYFPLGLLSIASILKKHKIESKIIDINNIFYNKNLNHEILNLYIENQLIPFITEYNPDIIGIGCIFCGAFKNLLTISQKIKKKFSEIPIVTGGIHPTQFPSEILKKYEFIDYIILGEGEHTFLELTNSLMQKDNKYEDIDGIAFRKNNNIIVNPKTKFIKNLHDLPNINYNIIDVTDYKMDTSSWYSPKNIPVKQPFPVITSRSCPNHCSFCNMRSVHGPKIRYRPPNDVLHEIEYLYDTYNIRYFQFIDDNLTFNRQRIIDICNGIIAKNLTIQFDTPSGVAISTLDKDVIDLMVEAGMVRISIAIESGSEYIRNNIMHKHLKTEKIFEVVDACIEHHHLFINAFFIIGMPQETMQTLEETYNLITKLYLDKYAISYATPFPGTELFNYCQKNKLLPFSFEEYIDVDDLQGRSDRPHFKPHNITIDELIEFKQKCENYMQLKREYSKVPDNYPLRFKPVLNNL